MSDPDLIKKKILELTREYSRLQHTSNFPTSDSARRPWTPGSPIPYAGRVFNDDEVVAAVSSTLTSGLPSVLRVQPWRTPYHHFLEYVALF